MRRIMTGLAFVWLATLAIMAGLQSAQHAARADVVHSRGPIP
jgi:hypothetical protein